MKSYSLYSHCKYMTYYSFWLTLNTPKGASQSQHGAHPIWMHCFETLSTTATATTVDDAGARSKRNTHLTLSLCLCVSVCVCVGVQICLVGTTPQCLCLCVVCRVAVAVADSPSLISCHHDTLGDTQSFMAPVSAVF